MHQCQYLYRCWERFRCNKKVGLKALMAIYYKISVITPSFNAETYIDQAISCVLDQNYPQFEHIIMDGGSTDGTIDILRKYNHLIWKSEKDQGQSHAMNKAFSLTTGDIIVVLNSDDFFEPGTFETVNDIFNSSRDIYFLVGGCNLLGENDRLVKKQDPAKCDLSLFGLLHWWWGYNHPLNSTCYFYKREVQENCGPFNENNHETMDYEFLLDCVCKYEFHKVSEVFGNYRYLPGTKTYRNNEKNAMKYLLAYSRRYWKYLPILDRVKIWIDYNDVIVIRPQLLKWKLIDDRRFYSYVRE